MYYCPYSFVIPLGRPPQHDVENHEAVHCVVGVKPDVDLPLSQGYG
jgi:hypothetical protein